MRATEAGLWLTILGVVIIVGLFSFPAVASALGGLDGSPQLALEAAGFLLLLGIPVLVVASLLERRRRGSPPR